MSLARFPQLAMAMIVLVAVAERCTPQGRLGRPGTFELSGSVRLQSPDVTVRGELEKVEVDRDRQRWRRLLLTLRQLIDRHGDVVVPVEPDLYLPLRSYAQAEIATLPAEVLADYRDTVDSRAGQWYADGVARHDMAPLERLLDRLFCSRWGDDALMALGEMALERGWYSAARGYWGRLSEAAATGLDGPPAKPMPVGDRQAADASRLGQTTDLVAVATAVTPAALATRQRDGTIVGDRWGSLTDASSLAWCGPAAPGGLPAAVPASRASWWIYYPDTDFSLAEIRARLVLVSIREGDLQRAGRQLQRFRQLHAQADGWLAGRRANYVDRLSELLAEAGAWPRDRPADDWPTLAGGQRRTSRHPPLGQLVSRPWQTPINIRVPSSGKELFSAETGVGQPAERPDQGGPLLNCHPVIVGDLALLCDETRIRGFDLRSGRPAWGTADGVVFAGDPPLRVATPRQRVKIGRPHHTLTVRNGLLVARMGDPTTSWAVEAGPHERAGYLVGLDLSADGRLLWKIDPDGPSWSFEGTPLADDANVYVAMRRSDVRPEAHVACFDAATGHRRWRRFICAADTPGQGQIDEVTNNLLTLAEGTIYFNTNLGAVAAVAPRDGNVRWIRRYRRVRRGDLAEPAANFRRQLTPCIYARGRVFVAPSDSQSIFALQAATGRVLWTNPQPDDVTELLGVGAGNLIASGRRLWWLNAEHGTVVWRWPEGKRSGLQPRGRGALIGTSVYWPCADAIRILPCRPTAVTRETEEPVRLDRFGIQPGNLVTAHGHLLIAGPRRLSALTSTRPPPANGPREHQSPKLAHAVARKAESSRHENRQW